MFEKRSWQIILIDSNFYKSHTYRNKIFCAGFRQETNAYPQAKNPYAKCVIHYHDVWKHFILFFVLNMLYLLGFSKQKHSRYFFLAIFTILDFGYNGFSFAGFEERGNLIFWCMNPSYRSKTFHYHVVKRDCWKKFEGKLQPYLKFLLGSEIFCDAHSSNFNKYFRALVC